MKITVLCSPGEHPIYGRLVEWVKKANQAHEAKLISRADQAKGGDLLFLISCSQIVGIDVISAYSHALVIHASDLPQGRGWSPHIWTILEGKNRIVVSLLEAAVRVDTGDIWKKVNVELAGHELFDEINDAIFDRELELMDFAVGNCKSVSPVPQSEDGGSYLERRTSEDSRLDPDKTVREQFDLLRVADPNRFPTFFELRGHKYLVKIEKDKDMEQ